MILICDECQSRYLVPSHSIGPDGRRVRCKSCNYEWFQEPEDKEGPEDDFGDRPDEEPPELADDVEPIPESLRPDPDEADLVPSVSVDVPDGKSNSPVYASYAVAAAVFFAIMGGVLLMHNSVVKIWPASMAFYDLVGLETAIDGEDLIFDQLSAEVRTGEGGVQSLNVKANILNLLRKESKVPFVQASIATEEGEVVDSWLTEPDSRIIESEGELVFHTTYSQISKDAKEVNLRFIVGSEIKTSQKEEVENVAEEHNEVSHEEETHAAPPHDAPAPHAKSTH